jgi:UDP-glucose 4-epimerase
MNTLVLGGNGFIGSHLVDLLIEHGHFVRIVDKSIEKFRNPIAKVDYRIINFDDSSGLIEALANIDIVFHLISTTVPSTSISDPIFDINSNLVDSVKLFDLMYKSGVERILFLSSGGTVYGNPNILPTPEHHQLNPISSYGIVKVAIENYLMMNYHLSKLKPIIVRASNPFGARQIHFQVQGVISTFLKNVLLEKDLEIFGNGENIRDYIFIKDLVDFCYLAAFSNECGIFNAGIGKGTSLNEIVEIIKVTTDKQFKVKYQPSRKFDVQKNFLDISKAYCTFGWKPQFSLENGIALYWDYLKKESGS